MVSRKKYGGQEVLSKKYCQVKGVLYILTIFYRCLLQDKMSRKYLITRAEKTQNSSFSPSNYK
jgi:hypothetical protein